jgi:hypothetical protein
MRISSSQESKTKPKLVPLPQAAAQRRMSREQLLRRVQRGEILGEFHGGRWFVADARNTSRTEG